LVFFTIALFVSALGTFITTFRDQFGLKKCVYGGIEYEAGQSIPDEPRCFCNEKGDVVCEEIEIESSLDTSDFINEDLDFSTSFLNFVDKGLKIVVERLTLCSEEEELPPQIGYYSISGNQLQLKTTTNLLPRRFNSDCMVSNTFLIHGLSEVSKVSYVSEDNRIIEADICVFNGRVYNKGDAFVGDNGEVVVCD
jgi:hypothetical protein